MQRRQFITVFDDRAHLLVMSPKDEGGNNDPNPSYDQRRRAPVSASVSCEPTACSKKPSRVQWTGGRRSWPKTILTPSWRFIPRTQGCGARFRPRFNQIGLKAYFVGAYQALPKLTVKFGSSLSA